MARTSIESVGALGGSDRPSGDVSMTTFAWQRIELAQALRCAVRALAIGVALAPMLLLHLVWRALKLPSAWPRLFLKVVARVLGIRVAATGSPLRRDVFYVANHVSWTDVAIFGGLTGTAFVAQHGVASWPVIGTLARLNRTIFVNRAGKQQVVEQIAQLRAAIAENWTVTLFPEGTTSDGLGLLPFKQALFATMVPPPRAMMIQPVWLEFGAIGPEVAWIGEETGWHSAWRTFARAGSYPVTVHFLEPFDPSCCADRKQISATARARIVAAMAAKPG